MIRTAASRSSKPSRGTTAYSRNLIPSRAQLISRRYATLILRSTRHNMAHEDSSPQLAEEVGHERVMLLPSSTIIAPGQTFASVTDQISDIVQTPQTPWGWFVGFGVSFLLVMLFLAAVSYLLAVGVGIWGINIPVAWGFAIVNFVWWIGIGHAGTLISA